MKYKKIALLLISATIFGLSSCKDDQAESGRTGEPLKIETSKDSLLLDENKSNEVAITFTWNKGLDLFQDDSVTYIFRLGLEGKNFTVSTVPEVISADMTSKSFTHKQLNEIITEDWLITQGKTINIEARISAKITSTDLYVMPEVAVAKVLVKSYKVSPQALFLMGSAIPGVGWDIGLGLKMTEMVNGKYYHWKGGVNAGNFKLLTTLGSELPSLNKGLDEQTVVERTDISALDNTFTVPSGGLYAIAINRRAMTIIHEKVIYERVWLIGSATPVGWGGVSGGADNIVNSIEMKWDPMNPNTFYFEGDLKEGEFKMPLSITQAWAGPYLMPPTNGTGIRGDNSVKYSATGQPDNKWAVTAAEAGHYRITVNTKTMKIEFKALD